jgi:hypothetical protein
MKELSNLEIVMLAFGEIGSHGEPIHQEHIYARCFTLAPQRFAWKLPEYNKWPNTEIIRRALRNASVSDLIGCHATKWYLTPKGINWLQENSTKFGKHVASSNNVKTDYTFFHRAQKSTLFQRYLRSGKMEQTDRCLFTDMLSLPPLAVENLIKSKVNLLEIVANDTQDDKFGGFVKHCKQLFLEESK